MNRPWVTINCAMSLDGKTALPTRKQLRISCEEDIRRMYELRNAVDAVLVGIGTILADDPKLTVKNTYVTHPKQPLRVVLDSKCLVPKDALVLDTTAKTLILTVKGNEKTFHKNHIEIRGCPTDSKGRVDLEYALELLAQKGVKKLLVEGGGTIIWEFLQKNLVDDLYVYIAPIIIGGAQTPTFVDGQGILSKDDIIHFHLMTVQKFGPGSLHYYKKRP